MKPTVYIVHCVDTEGPLYESLSATFDRLRHAFHLDLKPSWETLRKLQAGEMDLGGLEEAVREMVSPHLLNYNDTWDKIEDMLAEALSREFRDQLPDSKGKGWVYNWFCVDHVDYEVNPRHRDMGYHNIFDRYQEKLAEYQADRDGVHFHYRPHDFLKRAHACATHWWASSDSLYQVLCRRIIDRLWFPACNRPGFQVNRPDSHWFLEQFIPFDYSSLASAEMNSPQHFDFSAGRSGDWRRASPNWQPYHPSHDDYQVPGGCRRWITRCLNIGSRVFNLSLQDVRQAFAEAREGKPVLLSFADHDFRDIRQDVDLVRGMIKEVSAEFAGVDFVYSEAVEAMRQALDLSPEAPCDLKMELQAVGDAHVLSVETKVATFGPQPFLAIKTVTQSYHHDNLDFQEPFHRWSYTFDEETLPLRAVEKIGVGVNNSYGKSTVCVLDTQTGKVTTRKHN